MAFKSSDETCFTFLWKLENIDYSLEKKGEPIVSPSFVVDEMDESKWKLNFYPRGYTEEDWIACYLHREADSKGASRITIKFQLALLGNNDSKLSYYGVQKNTFVKGYRLGYPKFLKREDVFSTERSIFQKDPLTLRCKIWKSNGEMTLNARFFARTRVGVQKTSACLTIGNFSALEADKPSTYQVRSFESYEPLMVVHLTLTGGLSSFSGGILRFGLSLLDQTVKYCALRLNLVNAFGNIVKCNQEEFWFQTSASLSPYHTRELYYTTPVLLGSTLPRQSQKEFTFFFTKKQLTAMKSLYLPNDCLKLHWELVLSKGILSSETEEVQFPILEEQNACAISESEFSVFSGSQISRSNAMIDNINLISL